MRIYIYRRRDNKTFAGYVTADFPISTNSKIFEYILKDVNEDEYKKIRDGWEVEFNPDESIKLKKPQHIIYKENENVEFSNLKSKLKNDTATFDDVKKLLKLHLK